MLILELFRVTIDTICSGPRTLRNVTRLGSETRRQLFIAHFIATVHHCLKKAGILIAVLTEFILVKRKYTDSVLSGTLSYQGHGFLTFFLNSIMSLLKSHSGKLRVTTKNQTVSSLVVCIHETFSRMQNV